MLDRPEAHRRVLHGGAEILHCELREGAQPEIQHQAEQYLQVHRQHQKRVPQAAGKRSASPVVRPDGIHGGGQRQDQRDPAQPRMNRQDGRVHAAVPGPDDNRGS
jgi:hypothetical protein